MSKQNRTIDRVIQYGNFSAEIFTTEMIAITSYDENKTNVRNSSKNNIGRQDMKNNVVHFNIPNGVQMLEDGFLDVFIKSYQEFISLPNYDKDKEVFFSIAYDSKQHKDFFGYVLTQEWGPGELFSILSSITTLSNYKRKQEDFNFQRFTLLLDLIKSVYFPLLNKENIMACTAMFSFIPFANNGVFFKEFLELEKNFNVPKKALSDYYDLWTVHLIWNYNDRYKTFREAENAILSYKWDFDIASIKNTQILDLFFNPDFISFLQDKNKETITKSALILWKYINIIKKDSIMAFYNPLMKEYAQEHPDSFGVYDYAFSDDDMKKIREDTRFFRGDEKYTDSMLVFIFLLMMKYGYDRGLWLFDAISEEGFEVLFDSGKPFDSYSMMRMNSSSYLKTAIYIWMRDNKSFCDALDAFMNDTSIPLSLYYAMFLNNIEK